MSRTRELKLRKETLTELAASDLGRVVGASGVSCNVALCATACSSCASDFQQCFTGFNCLTQTLHCPPTGETAC